MDVEQAEEAEAVAVVGLGYVGIPLAVAFARRTAVVGYDVNRERLARFRSGRDPTGEVGDRAVAQSGVRFTEDPADLRAATAFVVAVPTPVDSRRRPDLSPLEAACRTLGPCLRRGSLVVFESTVYPGLTEDFCVPLLEAGSGLSCGRDFQIGYSPERISPGDREHSLEGVVKVVSGGNRAALERVYRLYRLILPEALLYRAPSIRVAEAAKLVENTQRDILIAFANELSQILRPLGLDTREVLQAAGTKWNFSPVRPGLVGGHCIGVDPYYLLHMAERLGHAPAVVAQGRRVNEGMPAYIARQAAEALPGPGRRALVYGFTYKENVPDIRNTKVMDLVRALEGRGFSVRVTDCLADPAEVEREYGLTLLPGGETRTRSADAVIFAVPHRAYAGLDLGSLGKRHPGALLVDVGRLFSREAAEAAGFSYWGL